MHSDADGHPFEGYSTTTVPSMPPSRTEERMSDAELRAKAAELIDTKSSQPIRIATFEVQ
jgi:hypothetical protein